MYALVLFSSGCYYRQLSLLHPPREGRDLSQKDVTVRIKELRDFECAHFFDSRLVTKGLQPIQIYIQNDSSKVFVLDATKLSVPLVGRRGVSAKVYKNVVGRSVVWFMGVSLLWKIFMPVLILDTLFCVQANQDAQRDIHSVCVQPKDKIVIQPHSRFHRVLFVPREKYHQHLSVTLQEQGNEEELVFTF